MYWSLSPADHVQIITQYFVPLTRKHTKSPAAIGPLLINLLSCLEPPPPRVVIASNPVAFADNPVPPFFVERGAEFTDFVKKVLGHVLRICLSLCCFGC